ncbi:hypothetical protein NITGR_590073 [Nitrospina gracilis 3/211]|uniref:RiboL-PSP-HEPN domain-containing protein n=1 Tax=Nitrospina gracilis (strain 3/211) TaxID=1266370 RepID=M1Z114_NITG3|nr:MULTISPECIES: HEPN domain-containing protein [Nitrospina]MCF8724062.1 hypothetical protein [Nitrospina sp. Nb-3]CCQ91194.1 hypothetical protein NITGR_590073 [Nitrospina gracilis 3/211]
MKNHLIKTVTAISECEIHLRDANAEGSEIEVYLAQYLVVILSAEMQQQIYKIIREVIDSVDDKKIKSFASNAQEKLFRSVGKGEIAGYLGCFGKDRKDKFNSLLEDRDVSLYNNAIGERHRVAHSTANQLTLREIKDALISAEKVLSAVKIALQD